MGSIGALALIAIGLSLLWYIQNNYPMKDKFLALLTRDYLPALLGTITLAYILCMLVVSNHNLAVPTNPDEMSHTLVARYYYDHWLPPRVGAPETLSTYSSWGYSYILEFDIVYLIAAKFANAIKPLVGNDVIALRLFQFSLFAALVSISWLSKSVRWAIIPCLMTPQVWYVYSYFNADALPLTISIILIALLFGNGRSILNIFNRENWRNILLALSLLLSLFILSKRNYWPILGFILPAQLILLGKLTATRAFFFGFGCTLLLIGFMSGMLAFDEAADKWSIISKDYRHLLMVLGLVSAIFSLFVKNDVKTWYLENQKSIIKVAIMFAIVFMIVGVRLAYDMNINGGFASRASMIHSLIESKAHIGFKPSTYFTESAHYSIALAAHGITISQLLFNPWHWIEISAHSFFGLYSYMNIAAPPKTYMILQLLFSSLILGAVTSFYSQKKQYTKPFLILSFWIFTVIILSSILLSWISAFQAQGRYLFPILSIFAALLLQCSEDKKFITFARSILVAAWLTSSISFIFTGLALIPK